MGKWLIPILSWMTLALPAVATLAQDPADKAKEVVDAAIEAMGGAAYLNAKKSHSYGRYFSFNRGRKGFAKFWDWTVYDPVKSRFQLNEGKKQYVEIYNLELEKGWILEGKKSVEDIPPERITGFKDGIKDDLHMLLKLRVHEEGMKLFYYTPDDVAGDGRFEAVEFLDSENNSVVVFFDTENHLPSKVESYVTDGYGVRHKRETELSNWHEIEGVNTPLRYDVYVDDEIVQQTFLEGISFSAAMPESLFLEPVVEK